MLVSAPCILHFFWVPTPERLQEACAGVYHQKHETTTAPPLAGLALPAATCKAELPSLCPTHTQGVGTITQLLVLSSVCLHAPHATLQHGRLQCPIRSPGIWLGIGKRHKQEIAEWSWLHTLFNLTGLADNNTSSRHLGKPPFPRSLHQCFPPKAVTGYQR
eukprot:1138547-Pelagomonas_calceolata.AAC.9